MLALGDLIVIDIAPFSLGVSPRRARSSAGWSSLCAHRGRLPRVYRAAALLDENRTLFTLQALTKANDAEDVRIESTKLKDYDIES